jgi:hypothetical protein
MPVHAWKETKNLLGKCLRCGFPKLIKIQLCHNYDLSKNRLKVNSHILTTKLKSFLCGHTIISM